MSRNNKSSKYILKNEKREIATTITNILKCFLCGRTMISQLQLLAHFILTTI